MGKENWLTPGILVSLALFIAEQSRGDSTPHQGGNNIPAGSASDYIKNNKNGAQLTQQYFSVPALFTLAQAGLETGWGTSNIARNSNNHFGIKADASWKGPVFTAGDGNRYRKYNSVQDSYFDHAKFLVENNRYRNAFSTADPFAFMQAVAAAGYAEDPQYASKVYQVMSSLSGLV